MQYNIVQVLALATVDSTNCHELSAHTYNILGSKNFCIVIAIILQHSITSDLNISLFVMIRAPF